MVDKKGFVYILTNKRNGTLYTGVTSDLEKRIQKHRSGSHEGFTKKYGCAILVWYNEFANIEEAIQREKKIKGRIRIKKLNLIEENNPHWNNLSEE